MALREFLETACDACKQYDREGNGQLPFDKWPRILDDMGLQENGEGCRFLMEHLAAASDTAFTYAPLVQALRDEIAGGPPQQAWAETGGDGGSHAGDSPGRKEASPPPSPPPERSGSAGGCGTGASGRGGGYNGGVLPGGGGGARRGEGGDHYDSRGGGSGSGPPPFGIPPRSAAPPDQGVLPAVGNRLMDSPGGHSSDAGGAPSCSDAVEEVCEAYWARRASAIQHWFTKWDCNQVSNEDFTVRLQEVLGEAVDVSGSDSEFVTLANRHRTARNMKFASLMSALRRDAQATNTRRFGRALSHTGLSHYAGSYTGSVYEGSEAGSEAYTHAAGRPTGAGSLVARQLARAEGSRPGGGARRHYPYAESQLSGAVPHDGSDRGSVAGSDRPLQQRARPGGLEGVDERGPVPHPVSQPPFAYGSTAAPPSPESRSLHGLRQSGGILPEAKKPYEHAAPSMDRSDVRSTAASDCASIADSQREVFTNRNRTGHGNILTWGNDSRSLTPHKTRQGRQLTSDADQGIPRSQMSSAGSAAQNDARHRFY